MNIEEAIKICEKIIQQNNEIVKRARRNKDTNVIQLTVNCSNESIAIQMVLQHLKFYKEGLEREIDSNRRNVLEIIQKDEELEKKEYLYKKALNDLVQVEKNIEKHKKIKEKLEELKKEYKQAIDENSIKAFILKCQIEVLEELLEKYFE